MTTNVGRVSWDMENSFEDPVMGSYGEQVEEAVRTAEGHRFGQGLVDGWAVFSGEHSFAQFFLVVFSLRRKFSCGGHVIFLMFFSSTPG